MSSTLSSEAVAIGVGLDTARYGHHATFLREDRQLATKPLEFLECQDGYQQFEAVLSKLAEPDGNVHFHIRVDSASQYATNLLTFLNRLPWPKTISVGQPLQNKRYREVHFPKRKADATDSRACARFAIVERPKESAVDSPQLLALQDAASRLEFQVKQSTREVNRLHNLLSRVFPELATLQNDLQVRWVLCLLEKYPTAQRIAKARLDSLSNMPFLRAKKAERIHLAAKCSVAAIGGPVMEEVVRESVRALQVSLDTEKRLQKLLIQAFRELPDKRARQIVTIKGIGERTAAVLVAKIGSIDRFKTADHLTSFFGVFPEENTSGVDRAGNPLPTVMRMSRKGNDLVRKCLWMSAMSAVTFNPAVKALYARLKQRGRRGDVALGHCMKKLVHQVFGIWTSGKPFDAKRAAQSRDGSCDHHQKVDENKTEAEGRKTGETPVGKPVTPASTDIVPPQQPFVKQATPPSESTDGSIDFACLRSQISMEQILQHLGYFDRLRGGGVQRRGPCPIHGTKRERGRSFSVHLGKDVFQCFHPPCGASGNILDLWCAVHQLTTYEGAQHLASTFDLELNGGEKRNP